MDELGEGPEGLHVVHWFQLWGLAPGLRTPSGPRLQGAHHREELCMGGQARLGALRPPQAEQGVVRGRGVDVVTVWEDLLSEGAIVSDEHQLDGQMDIMLVYRSSQLHSCTHLW